MADPVNTVVLSGNSNGRHWKYFRVLAETYKWAGTVCIYYSDPWPRNSEEPWRDLKHGDGAVLP